MRHETGQSALIGADELAMMKKNAILVNCARAGLVDTAALVEALRAHRIGGAAIDVFDEEPLSPDSPLLTLDNVTLTPHIAGTTVDAFANSVEIMLRQLSLILAGKDAPNRVRPYAKPPKEKILRRFCVCGFQLFMIRSVAARAWAMMSSGDSPTW